MQNYRLQKQLIIAGLAILLLADLALAIYSVRMLDSRQNPQVYLETQKRRVALVKADVARATDIQKRIPAQLKALDEFEGSLLPAPNGYSSISEELTELAKKNRITVAEGKFHQKEIGGRGLVEVEIEATVGGDYGGIVHFLNALQRSKSVYIVDSLQVETEAATVGQGAPGNLRVNLHLRTYFRKV